MLILRLKVLKNLLKLGNDGLHAFLANFARIFLRLKDFAEDFGNLFLGWEHLVLRVNDVASVTILLTEATNSEAKLFRGGLGVLGCAPVDLCLALFQRVYRDGRGANLQVHKAGVRSVVEQILDLNLRGSIFFLSSVVGRNELL